MENNNLWYTSPAKTWMQGMPLGNGHLGAMVLGKLRNETIYLNDDTAWARVAENRNNPESLKYLPEIRELLLAGKIERATALAEAAMVGTPRKQSPYQMLGELNLLFTDHIDDSIEEFRRDSDLMDDTVKGHIKNYCRSLDLQTAIAQVEYSLKDVRYHREHFVSGKDGVLVIHLSASEKASLNLMLTLYRRFDAQTKVLGNNRMMMYGQCGTGGSKFCTLLHVDTNVGSVKAIGNYLCIEHADSITLTFASETDMRSKAYMSQCETRINAAQTFDYAKLKQRHIQDHQNYYNRMQFSLKDPVASNLALPTDERLARLRDGERDLGLVETYFNFGRYLLISSSRPGSMPANLQGIWCDSYVPMWDSKYTININTQMNYWAAESCGLGDCHKPLLEMLDRARENGRATAKEMYGCKGFVIHHNLDGWCDTAPLDHTRAGVWPMGGAWLCYHLWEHYEYSCDRAFLAENAYPIMKEAAEFLLDYMFEDASGQLLSGPSISPENRYILPDGQVGFLCISPAMDTQIISGLLKRCLMAAEVLGIDDAFTKEIHAAISKLPPMKVGANGSLQEWFADDEDGEPGHRHLSHLFAVYPDRQISAASTPELYEAARNSLENRIHHGSGGTGWSEAWIIALWARFGEGDLAFGAVERLLKTLTADSLLDIHPPEIFQIDGNLGAIAGMLECLLQDSGDRLMLFPALPSDWEEGCVRGVHIKGGLRMDIQWKNGSACATFTAEHPASKQIFVGSGNQFLAEIALKKGETYTIEFDLNLNK